MRTRTTRTTKRAPRSKAVEQAPVPVTPPEPAKPSYARGNPLTHSVTFVDTSGMCWLVYVEPAPPQPALWPNAAVLPGRRLRFDSLDRSVTVSPFPAGAPFLQEQALQQLLDLGLAGSSHPVSAPVPRVRTPLPEPRHSIAVAPSRTRYPGAGSRSGAAAAHQHGERPEWLDLPVVAHGAAGNPGSGGHPGHDSPAARLTASVWGRNGPRRSFRGPSFLRLSPPRRDQ